MNEEDNDPTGGALYYAYLLAMDPGGWFERNFANTPEELPEVSTIGHLVFNARHSGNVLSTYSNGT